jgi:L-serine deaminase
MTTNQNDLHAMTLSELEQTWRSIKDRALQERDWVASSLLGRAARDIEQAIGEALVSSGVVNDTVEATAQAASEVLNAGASVTEAVVATAPAATPATPTLVDRAIAAGTEATDLGVNVAAGGVMGWALAKLVGSKSPLAVGAIGAVAGAMFRPIRRTAP